MFTNTIQYNARKVLGFAILIQEEDGSTMLVYSDEVVSSQFTVLTESFVAEGEDQIIDVFTKTLTAETKILSTGLTFRMGEQRNIEKIISQADNMLFLEQKGLLPDNL